MKYDPPLAYRVHRITLVGLFALVALVFCLGVAVAAEPFWHSITDLAVSLRDRWRSW
ncbi:hypothetical protein [Lentzea guizhouensis]|uniref:hypothetical protein n=1 Tax=Lentzea guizhouensis TaxID=1586287 RepID=UPI0012B687ED|nr:hypothetical protein [Lentzea guizhouensis]